MVAAAGPTATATAPTVAATQGTDPSCYTCSTIPYALGGPHGKA